MDLTHQYSETNSVLDRVEKDVEESTSETAAELSSCGDTKESGAICPRLFFYGLWEVKPVAIRLGLSKI